MKPFKSVLASMIIVATISLPVYATPTISAVTRQGNAFVVSGSGFGTDAGVTAPLFWDNFDSGTANSYLVTQMAGSVPWTLNTTPKATYTTLQKHSGTQSAYALHSNGYHWSFFTVGNLTTPLPSSLTYYQTFWFRYNTPRPLGTTGETKLARIFGNDLTYGIPDKPYSKTGGVGSWWFTNYKTENATSETTKTYPQEPSESTWHRVDAYYKQSSVGGAGDGAIKILIDGVPQVDLKNLVTRDTNDYRWITVDFFGGMTNWDTNNTGLTWQKWIDDAYLSKTWQHVEICDSPTWTAGAHCEIQPVTAWSDTQITAPINAGSFPNGQSAYLYVMDLNGVVNSTGTAVTIGTIPTAPKNVTVTPVK
ncbi:hypothetical protein KP003_10935 [Geomonas nitrogeniifigens]|uniref:Uncharacterized protein n=1 Tax=Geomonas diazotrophica TaxID=2843197 RepID=A0ABX8JBZ0_9BACT|nr:hypothetical protein [Geomonas nitrogeniifigens]QWV95838.1 hypothetical protein KP005_10565 [Geomonas nitrogeniifigens]QXE84923.1 hypothetical protein KP003_10935 [Geomonas nitrogeniifigens]